MDLGKSVLVCICTDKSKYGPYKDQKFLHRKVILNAPKTKTTSVTYISFIRSHFSIGQNSIHNVEKEFLDRLSWGYCNNHVA